MSESKIMTAKEAYTLLRETVAKQMASELNNIENQIKKAIEDNRDFIVVPKNMVSKETVKELVRLGYVVKSSNNFDSGYPFSATHTNYGPRAKPQVTIGFGQEESEACK